MRLSSRSRVLGVTVSILLHLGVAFALSVVPARSAPTELVSTVDFELPKLPERTDPPPARRSEPDAPLAAPMRSNSAKRPAPASPPVTPAPSAEQATPRLANLTGLTLQSDTGSASWSSPVGDGSATTEPSQTGPSTRPVQRSRAPAKPRKVASSVVPLADLSERPLPPKLDSLLEQNYPAIARRQGKAGNAIVRLRIDADGRVRRARVLSGSTAAFGRACRATVLGSRWTPPRDRRGQSVATLVSYTCRFRVEP